MFESLSSAFAFLADGSLLSQALLMWLSGSLTCWLLTRWPEFLLGSAMAVLLIGLIAVG